MRRCGRAEHAWRHGLSEHDAARGYRQRVRQQHCQTGDSQRATRECAKPPPERERDDRRSGRRREPEKDLDSGTTGTLTAPAGQRHRQREQPEHRQKHTCKLVPTEAAPAQTCGGVGEDADPARRDTLNERERCERKRTDVERKAAAFEREAEQPAAICQERFDRVKRAPKRKSGQSGGGIVLTQVPTFVSPVAASARKSATAV